MKKRTVARFILLVVTSIVGMAMLGVVAFVVANVSGDGFFLGRPSLLEFPMLAIPATIGAIVGFFSMPMVVALLADADLKRSIPFVYGVSLLVTASWALLVPAGFGISASFPAFFSVLIAGRWCSSRFALHSDLGHCEKCGYNLRGCVEPGCPECGLGRTK